MITTNTQISNRPSKIALRHLERNAVVYVRQSHPQQVQRHPESALVQANLQELALGWGWPRERILVFNGDQGRSGLTTDGRDDFARLLAEIALGRVGLVLGFQFNRLVREDEACCRLIKMCSNFDTLVADLDGLYHPLDFNDRLVLTFKGIMGGIELHQIQQRMQAGRLNRARRGEWLGQVPPGYVIGADRKLQFDPDEQVQRVIRLVLKQFEILGSLSGLSKYLRQHHIDLPCRVLAGPNRGQLQWHQPHRETLRSLVRRPAYAGVYTWGRHCYDPKRKDPAQRGRGRVEREPQDCAVFLPDNHPFYITWERYQGNLELLRQQRRRGPVPGPARQTVALLAGLVVCGACGCRMSTHYTRTLRYNCQRHALDYSMPRCQSLAGEPLERLVAEQVLQVVTPAGMELSLRVTAERERERAALDTLWEQRRERARQDVARAYRQYDAVEPENRLVARTLERKWEESQRAQSALEEDYARYSQTRPEGLTAAELGVIETLAGNLRAIWNSPQSGLAEKRRIVRSLLERVVVWAPASTEEVTVHLSWSLGTVTEHRMRRSVGSWERLSGVAAIRQHLVQWQALGWSSGEMAAALNAAGYQTPRGLPLTAETVRQLRSRGIAGDATGRTRAASVAKHAEDGQERRGPQETP